MCQLALGGEAAEGELPARAAANQEGGIGVKMAGAQSQGRGGAGRGEAAFRNSTRPT